MLPPARPYMIPLALLTGLAIAQGPVRAEEPAGGIPGFEIVAASFNDPACRDSSSPNEDSHLVEGDWLCDLGNGHAVAFSYYDGRGSVEIVDSTGASVFEIPVSSDFINYDPPIGLRDAGPDGAWGLTLLRDGGGLSLVGIRVEPDGGCLVPGIGYDAAGFAAAMDAPCAEQARFWPADGADVPTRGHTLIGPFTCTDGWVEAGASPEQACATAPETSLRVGGDGSLVTLFFPWKPREQQEGAPSPDDWMRANDIAGPVRYEGAVEWRTVPDETEFGHVAVLLPLRAGDASFLDVRLTRDPITHIGFARTREEALAMLEAQSAR